MVIIWYSACYRRRFFTPKNMYQNFWRPLPRCGTSWRSADPLVAREGASLSPEPTPLAPTAPRILRLRRLDFCPPHEWHDPLRHFSRLTGLRILSQKEKLELPSASCLSIHHNFPPLFASGKLSARQVYSQNGETCTRVNESLCFDGTGYAQWVTRFFGLFVSHMVATDF